MWIENKGVGFSVQQPAHYNDSDLTCNMLVFPGGLIKFLNQF